MPTLIDWTRPSMSIAALVGNGGAYTFFQGFQVFIEACELAPANGQPPGALVVDGDHLIVSALDGAITVRSYRIIVAGDASGDIANFASLAGITGPFRFDDVMFSDNAAANMWEVRVRRWRLGGNLTTNATHNAESASFSEHERSLMACNSDLIPHLIDRFALPKNGRGLDLGCGTGWASALMAHAGLRPVGLDILPDAVRTAAALVPEGRFEVCDLFEVARRTDLNGQFDLILCRDVGVAQKIVDWEDPAWISVGRALVGFLRPAGVLYWIQMTNGSDMITEDGFSNASIRTMTRYFSHFGRIVGVGALGYVSVALARPDAPAGLSRHVASFDCRTAQAALARIDDRAPVRSGNETLADLVRGAAKAVIPVLSPLLTLDPPRGICVAGIGPRADVVARRAEALGLPVLAFVTSEGSARTWRDIPVVSMTECVELGPRSVIVTDPSARALDPAPDGPQLIYLDGGGDGPCRHPAMVVDRDHDAYFEPLLLEGADLRSGPAIGRRLELRNSSLADWDDLGPRDWQVGGGARVEQRTDAIRLRPRGNTASLIQRIQLQPNPNTHAAQASARLLVCGAWIRSSASGRARVQITFDGLPDMPSDWHPGNGQWHYVAAELTVPNGACEVDMYLQVVLDGAADFRWPRAELLEDS